MKTGVWVLALALALTGAPAVTAAQSPTATSPALSARQVVQAVAGRIRDQYFDPAAGDRFASGLEAEAASGAFDGLEGSELAAALTSRIHPLDGHFRVIYDPRAPGGPDGPPMREPEGPQRVRIEGPGPESGPRRGPDPRAARDNYGFREVEILPGNIGYVRMSGFAGLDFDDPLDPARRAADSVLTLVSGADAVIFDLRDNGGGAPAMVGYLASAFTPANAPIYNIFHSREGETSEAPKVFYATPRLTTPLYILTSARTASAGESFPYTLQAAGRATIVGEVTGGAANPGGMVPAGGGFAVFVPRGTPVNPITGTNWESVGVRPDVETPRDQALDRAQALALQAILDADPSRVDVQWMVEARQAGDLTVDLAPYVGTYGEGEVALVEGRLAIVNGRRPPMVLRPLGDDLFYVDGEPGRRARFVRDENGRVTAVETQSAGGPVQRLRRTG